MPIEKAFAINASPQNIYAALERDLISAGGDAGETFEVLRRERDRSLELRVTIGGVPCMLSYRLEPKPEHTEVVAVLEPFGWRYGFFRLITLGLGNQGFEVALVEGLANLKAAVEEPTGENAEGTETEEEPLTPDS